MKNEKPCFFFYCHRNAVAQGKEKQLRTCKKTNGE